MDFRNILGKLTLLEGTMAKAESNPTGPEFTGHWKGKDAGTPGKKLVGDSVEPEENILKDLSKGPTAKTKEQELAEAYQEFLDEENFGVAEKRPLRKGARPSRNMCKTDKPSERYTPIAESVDDLLTSFRNGWRNIEGTDFYGPEYKKTIASYYSLMRKALMADDVDYFWDCYNEFSSLHPDEFVDFLDECGLGSYDDIKSLLSVEESRGHTIIANKLRDKEQWSKRQSDAEAYQAHIDRMKAQKKEYLKKNPNSIYKQVDEYGANQPTGTAGQKMVQTAMPTTQDVAAQAGNDPKKAAAVAQATQTIKSASGASAPNDVIAKALDAVSKGQQVSPQDMKTLEPVLKNVAAAGQDPSLANDYKTLAQKAKIFQQTNK